MKYYVIGFEQDRYTAGYAVKDQEKEWGDFEAVFYPQLETVRAMAQAKLNAKSKD